MPQKNNTFVEGPDVLVNAPAENLVSNEQPGSEVLDQHFPHIMFGPESPARKTAVAGFVGGLGAMLSETPFGNGFRKSLVDSTIDTAGTLAFEFGTNVDESAVTSEDLYSPKGILKIAESGPASLFLAGDRARADAIKRTRVPFEFQRLGLDLQKKSREVIDRFGLDPAYEKEADKFLHDLGAGGASVLLALGSSVVLGEGMGATYFGLIQKAQTYKEMTRTANLKNVKTGVEAQVDFDEYRHLFKADPEGRYAEKEISSDGMFELTRAPLDSRTAGAYSTLAGVNEAALEWVGINMVLGRMRKMVGLRKVNKALGKAAIKGVRALESAAYTNPLMWTFLVAGEQAFQEALQQGAEEALAKIGWSRPGTKSDIAKRVGYSAMLGFFIGVPTGGLSTFALNRGVRADLIRNGMTEKQADRYLEIYSSRVIELGRDDAMILVNDLLAESSPMFQSKEGQPVFVSALEQRLEERMPESATPAHVMGILREGVKTEEIESSGIMDFLAGKDRVSKKELLDHIRTNQIEIKEVEKADGSARKLTPEEEGRLRALERLNDMGRLETAEQNADYLALKEKSGGVGNTKFSQYVLPGGENYRELLLTLPAERDKLAVKKYGKKLAELSGEERKDINYGVEKSDFTSSHFEEPNVLAHVRFNDRVGAKGERILFIEEIQSDWHQQGRKKGYQPKDVAKLEARRRELERMGLEAKQEGKEFPSELKQEWADIMNRLRPDNRDYEGNTGYKGVPDAPFKKTWHELVLKRMLRYASENGYDAIAWTTGEQQAGRYDLSKHIEKIYYGKNDDGSFYLEGDLKNGGQHVFGEKVPADKLDDYVGKEIAKKITSGEGGESFQRANVVIQKSDSNGRFIVYKDDQPEDVFDTEKEASDFVREKFGAATHFLKGVDLKVGGEGMKGFYDQIIPAFLNKYTKKWGGKVSSLKIASSDQDMTDEENWNEATQTFSSSPVVIKVHALDITDAMREGVMAGQPLFQSGSESEATTKKEALGQWKKLKQIIPSKYWAVVTDLVEKDFNAFTELTRKLVVLTADLKKTTVPHEAFHVIYNELLNENERQALRDEVFLKEGFSDPLEQEEWLAERFAEDWLGRQDRMKTLGGRIQQFLTDTAGFLKSFIANLDNIENAFRDISQGAFSRRMDEARENLKVRFQKKPEEEKPKKGERPEFIIDVDFTDNINEVGELVGKLGSDDKKYVEARFELDLLEMEMESIKNFRDRVGKVKRYAKNYLKEELDRIPKRYATRDKSARTMDELVDEMGYKNMNDLIDDMVKNEAKFYQIRNRLPDLYDIIDSYEKLEKYIQKEVKKAVEKKLPPVARGGIVPPELDFGTWKDTDAFSLARETLERNVEDAVDKAQVDTVKKFIVQPIKDNETKRNEFVSDMRIFIRGEMERLGIKKESKEDKLVMAYGEKRVEDHELNAAGVNVENVKEAARIYRRLYDQLLDQINDVREAFGYEPILKRQDYFRHFLDLGNVLKEFGMIFKLEELPTTIAGVTYTFRPGRPFTTTQLSREGGHFKESAIGGFDNYLDAVSKQMFHTDSVQRVRVLDKYIRNFYSAGERRLGHFVQYLEEYGNLLAGKQSQLDRGSETYIGRYTFKAFDWLRARTSGAMIAGNISSALTNTIPFTMFFATTDKESAFRGMFESGLTPFKRGESFMVDGQKSDLFARRYPLEKVQTVGWETVEQVLNTAFNWIDMYVGKSLIAGKYYEGVKMGMDKAAAMKRADDYTARVLADRSWGQIPIIFRARSLGLFSQFQVETNNMWSNILKDLPREYKDDAAKLFFAFVQYFLYSHIFNNVFQFVNGRRPTLDPIQALLILIGWAKEGRGRPVPQRAWTAFKSVADDVPFINFLLRGGRFPITDVFPDIEALAEGRRTLWGEGIKTATSLFPGGGQFRKSVEGTMEFSQGASYTPTGRLRYVIEQNPANFFRGLIFGKYAFPEAQDYFATYGVAKGGTRRTRR